jgi:outer membrane protein assembly factor BamB
MELRTAVAATLVLLALSSVAIVGLADSGPDLHERWTSDTSRDDRRNHHAVGVGGDVVVAPVTTAAAKTDVSPTACALVRFGDDGSVRWRAGVAAANCTAHALTQPAIGDFDDDGTLEVATSTTEQVVRVHDAGFGDEQWRVPLSTYGYSQPAVGNLTSDPGNELLVSDIQGGVVAINGENVSWRRTLGGFVWADPVVDDVDGDGTAEALVATSENTTLLSPDGQVEWTAPVAGESMTTLQVGDGARVFVATTGTVAALDGATGETVWSRDIDGIPAVHAVSDGQLYVSVAGGNVLALDARTGDREWRFTFPATERRPTPPPAVGDVDGDGDAEVVAVDNTGEVALLDAASGSQIDTYSRDVPIWTFPTVADVDGDGSDEIFVRYGDGRVTALEAV